MGHKEEICRIIPGGEGRVIGSWKCYTGGDLREEIQGRIQAGDLKEHTLGNSGVDTMGYNGFKNN